MAFPDHVAPFPEAVELIYAHPTAAIQSSEELIGHGQTLPLKKLCPIRCYSVQWPANPQPNYRRQLAASHDAGEHPTTPAYHCDPRLGLMARPTHPLRPLFCKNPNLPNQKKKTQTPNPLFCNRQPNQNICFNFCNQQPIWKT
ncbi:hypothetical protein FH972_008464 [Carpinus fangiana]|uniref:Uncharacterized protein n=1 Tax=Carpinus fangiana TaxID=176857 RepID=A0A5N6R142_9ROSI|nr:hypothetical protein FH972_008464 [Carpinus fangiana]